MSPLNPNRQKIASLGYALLDKKPNAIVSFRLLRDVLCLPADDLRLAQAFREVSLHPWAIELAQEQLSDGSWGRFHSMDSSRKARFVTSEVAIHRALALGLNKDSQVLAKAIEYMQAVLNGQAAWSDHPEKSAGWHVGVQAITSGILSEVDATNPAIFPAWNYWAEIAAESFPGGIYQAEAEWKAHKKRRGIGIIYLRSRYVLCLLGIRSSQLPDDLDRLLVNWIWNCPDGIGYLGENLMQPKPFHIFQWLESLEILSRFKSWSQFSSPALTWLWKQRNSSGLWDFGSKVSRSPNFPLSDTWRKAGNREIDHSVQVLVFLRKAIQG